MAAFGVGGNRRLTGHGSPPGFRFTLYALLSIVVMVLDQRGGWLNQARFLLQAAAYPLQLAVSSPSAAWAWMQQSMQTREVLRELNRGAAFIRRDDVRLRLRRGEQGEGRERQREGGHHAGVRLHGWPRSSRLRASVTTPPRSPAGTLQVTLITRQ